ncbi:YgiQ family radical SAM protein, partial [Oscillospiraceae bacterium OttesenSCG-928-G22]|nr:YgiQ family radical SAM protein [Oscillospiraceae bacterium OttesenSCG-928-G22]
VDHPSFGVAVIGRVLEDAGFRVAILAQPGVSDTGDFLAFGAPRYAVLVTSGNVDSMVANYSASKHRRKKDDYSPGGKPGKRPDYAVSVYAKLAREAFPDTPVLLGGLEASLRRFAHYDYWSDRVLPSILFDAEADLLMYGMGERAVRDIAAAFRKKIPVSEMTGIPGTCYAIPADRPPPDGYLPCPSYRDVASDKREYAKAAKLQYDEHDAVRGRGLFQRHGDRILIQNPPAKPLKTAEFDAVCELPYAREPHPMYDPLGGVPAISEVRFSLIHNRGCFGACNFCALSFHQGRMISARSHASLLREAEALTRHPDFKGYIHDVGGPTANFRLPSCKKQTKSGMCKHRRCLTPAPCPELQVSHSDYLTLLRSIRSLPGVKKVFVRSGVRFDYLMADKNGEFFSELVRHHVSGQLKVAPEHCADTVLAHMAKPPFSVYRKFEEKYARLNAKHGLKQFLVPYLISSHPGSTLSDAVALAEYLNATKRHPEQVQDFYPTPGSLSTCMYYTGLDPETLTPVHIPRSKDEKAMQRALLQWRNPKNYELVKRALLLTGRSDLIGYGKHCLIPPRRRIAPGSGGKAPPNSSPKKADGKQPRSKQGKRKKGKTPPGR